MHSILSHLNSNSCLIVEINIVSPVRSTLPHLYNKPCLNCKLNLVLPVLSTLFHLCTQSCLTCTLNLVLPVQSTLSHLYIKPCPICTINLVSPVHSTLSHLYNKPCLTCTLNLQDQLLVFLNEELSRRQGCQEETLDYFTTFYRVFFKYCVFSQNSLYFATSPSPALVCNWLYKNGQPIRVTTLPDL